MHIILFKKQKANLKTLKIPVAIISVAFIFVLELAGSSLLHSFLLVAESRLCSPAALQRPPIATASLWTWALECVSFSTGHMGFGAPQPMECSGPGRPMPPALAGGFFTTDPHHHVPVGNFM